MSPSEWKQLETAIFSSKVTFITMRTIIEYMQLCHIHLYQNIARKKGARVNAALGLSQHFGQKLKTWLQCPFSSIVIKSELLSRDFYPLVLNMILH